jgi:hypothetical protein
MGPAGVRVVRGHVEQSDLAAIAIVLAFRAVQRRTVAARRPPVVRWAGRARQGERGSYVRARFLAAQAARDGRLPSRWPV